MINIVDISKKVLSRLSNMDYEKTGGRFSEQLIFPQKVQGNGEIIDRISEQELRLLFIEEFKKDNKDLFYSIETPTVNKFSFGKSYDSIKSDINGKSALFDMCVFKRVSNKYERILNIEFKHKNASIKKIGKDVIKLMKEQQEGAIIFLLENTNNGTLCNKNKSGVLNKFYKSFSVFKDKDEWDNNKGIHLIIMSLKQKILIHRKIHKTDKNNLKEIFFIDKGCKNMSEIEIVDNGWNKININE